MIIHRPWFCINGFLTKMKLLWEKNNESEVRK